MSLTSLGAQLNEGATTGVTYAVALTTPVGTLLLIDDEVLVQTGSTSVTRGVAGTVDAEHDNGSSVYEVINVFHPGGSIEVHYIGADGTPLILNVPTGATNPAVPPIGGAGSDAVLATLDGVSTEWDQLVVRDDGTHTLPAALTDSTGKTASTTALIVSRTDTVANAASDIQTNIATLYAYAKKTRDMLANSLIKPVV